MQLLKDIKATFWQSVVVSYSFTYYLFSLVILILTFYDQKCHLSVILHQETQIPFLCLWVFWGVNP